MKKFLSELPDFFTILQGIVAIIVLGVWAALLLTGKDIPQEVSTLVALVIGYFFGGVSSRLISQIKGAK